MTLILNDRKLEYSLKTKCIRNNNAMNRPISSFIYREFKWDFRFSLSNIYFRASVLLLDSLHTTQLSSTSSSPASLHLPAPVSPFPRLTGHTPTRSQPRLLWLPPANCQVLVDLSLYLPEQSRALISTRNLLFITSTCSDSGLNQGLGLNHFKFESFHTVYFLCYFLLYYWWLLLLPVEMVQSIPNHLSTHASIQSLIQSYGSVSRSLLKVKKIMAFVIVQYLISPASTATGKRCEA